MRRAVLGFVAVLCLSACSGDDAGSGSDGAFNAGDAQAYPLPCLEHQENLPGEAYIAGMDANTEAILAMLRYFTANEAVRTYCDGKPPSEIDRGWAQLYVDLGAKRENVAHLLG